MKTAKATKIARRIAKAHAHKLIDDQGLWDLMLDVTDPLREAILADGEDWAAGGYLTDEQEQQRYQAIREALSEPLKKALWELNSGECATEAIRDQMSFLVGFEVGKRLAKGQVCPSCR